MTFWNKKKSGIEKQGAYTHNLSNQRRQICKKEDKQEQGIIDILITTNISKYQRQTKDHV